MKVVCFIVLLFTYVQLSCSGKKEEGVITYELNRADYVDKLSITGTIQAVVNYPVMPPGGYFGQTIVKRLSPDGSFVRKGDTICVLSNPELESMHKNASMTVDSLQAALKRNEADNKLKIALLEAQLATCEAQLKISSLDSLRLKYATPVERKLLELEMQKSRIEKEKTEKKLSASRTIGEKEISQTRSRIIDGKAKLTSLTTQVKSLIITAQREGIIMRAESPRFYFMGPGGSGTTGGPVREGSVLLIETPVLQFPDLSRMQVSAEVAEADFRKIESGQYVRISVDGAQRIETTGKINRKNLIGRNNQINSESEVRLYEVIIDIDSCHSKLTPGRSALCEIKLAEAKDTLFVPTLAIFERDSAKIVYVRKFKRFAAVPVKTGLSGSSFTIIAKGLKGGEIIALSAPPKALIANEPISKKSSDTARVHKPEKKLIP